MRRVPAPLLALLLVSLAAAPVTGAEVDYRRPVDGPVVRPFRAPPGPFGPGHRGVDLGAVAGTPVGAAARGTVVFAGAVAGRVWVTVAHPDGVRTTYGPLADLRVRAGQPVAPGAVVGVATGAAHPDGPPAVHLSARRDGDYLDPMTLFGDDPDAWTAALVGSGAWWAHDGPDHTPYAAWDGRHRLGLVPRSRRAEAPGWLTPPNPHHVVAIAGLASATGEPPLDLTHLGYDPADVTQLSYRSDGPYGPVDTWQEVDRAARLLRDQLRRRWAAEPGRAVDLVGHSLGGVVAMHYLLAHHDPTDPSLPPIGHVVTIASPLEGADLARLVVDVRRDALGRLVTDAASRLLGDHDAGAPVIGDLATGSVLTARLADAWAAARDVPYAGPLATGTRVLALGADLDVVVPVHRSDLPGADHVVVPGTHDGARHTEAVRWVLRAFLSGAPVPGEDGGLAHWLSHAVGAGERALGGMLLPGG